MAILARRCAEGQHSRGKQSRLFLKSINDNFLTQVTEAPMRRAALLDLILTNKEGLLGAVKVEGSLCCTDHDMVGFRIGRGGRGQEAKLQAWSSEEQNLASAGICLRKVPWDLDRRGVWESWLILKNHLLQAQQHSIPMSRKPGRKAKRLTWINKELLANSDIKGKYTEGGSRTGNLGGI